MLVLWTKGPEAKNQKLEEKESNKHQFSSTSLASKSVDAFIFIAFLKTFSLNCSQEIAEGRNQKGGKEREK